MACGFVINALFCISIAIYCAIRECLVRFLNVIFRGVSIETPPFLATRNLASQSMLICLPGVAICFVALFAIATQCVEEIMDRAISRNAQLQTRSISIVMEQILEETRNNLLQLAAGALDGPRMATIFLENAHPGAPRWLEAAFIGTKAEDCYILLKQDGGVVSVPLELAGTARGSVVQGVQASEAGHVSVSRPLEVGYQLPPVNNAMRKAAFHVLRFSTPVHDAAGNFRGVFSLSLDLRSLRDKLSILPHEASDDEGARGKSFFFDRDGWMIFQSEQPDEGDKHLGTDAVRTGFRGDFGRPGLSLAFRPASEHLGYWTMVSDIQGGHDGMISLSINSRSDFSFIDEKATAVYSPISFVSHGQEEPQVIGGIALLNANPLAASRGRIVLVFVLLAISLFALMAWGIWRISRRVARQVNGICREVDESAAKGVPLGLSSRPIPVELEQLRGRVGLLLTDMANARKAGHSQEAARALRKRRQPSDALPECVREYAGFLVGRSAVMRSLYSQIEKASRVDADVLVIGETGSGKELVAAAIHRLSSRADFPYMSINCGALDESLLMDTLFGHIKGAFSEARSDRKGAFLAASGGTLLLDEIGNAPLKVQQALLRALSTRRIRPLGSDADVSFDTRIIAATNASLQNEEQDFRNDLYYRLAVITIETPPLRDRVDDLPELVAHFMAQNCAPGESLPPISHGAMEKLAAYSWPGNVRELKNVITRAMAFRNGRMIMEEDLRLDVCASGSADSNEISPAGIIRMEPGLLARLNQRQRDMWPEIVLRGGISRREYQDLVREKISARTAQYDLKILLDMGLLTQVGKGPGQRYLLRDDRLAEDGNSCLENTG